MRSLRFLAALGVLAIGGGLVLGTTVDTIAPVREAVPPLGSKSLDFVFEGNKRACAVVIGFGPPAEKGVPLAQHTMLGMYVCDAFGNCVARDDIVSPKVRDDLAAEWYPTETARYTIEIVNFGNQANSFVLAPK